MKARIYNIPPDPKIYNLNNNKKNSDPRETLGNLTNTLNLSIRISLATNLFCIP